MFSIAFWISLCLDCKRKESKINLSFPYETFADDHCETPLEAYEHIKPILRRIAKKLLGRKKSKSLKIWQIQLWCFKFYGVSFNIKQNGLI